MRTDKSDSIEESHIHFAPRIWSSPSPDTNGSLKLEIFRVAIWFARLDRYTVEQTETVPQLVKEKSRM